MDAILSGFGLSGAAGLNAYIPLLILGIANRLGYAHLSEPYSVLGSNAGLGVLAVLLLVELFADKIPGVDHINDLISTVIRPAAGSVLFLSANGAGTLHPVLAGILGLLMAGSVHVTKATARTVVTASTIGVGNPIVSILEDLLALAGTLVAIFLPILVALFLIALLAFIIIVWRRRNRTRRQREQRYALL